MPTNVADFHEGPVTYRVHDWGVVTLCPYGHVVTGSLIDEMKNWGGSYIEAEIAATRVGRRKMVRCYGALPGGVLS